MLAPISRAEMSAFACIADSLCTSQDIAEVPAAKFSLRTQRQAQRAGRSGLVSREINWPRAEIAARPVQSIAARGAQGDVAGGRTVVGLPLGARGDVGAPQVGREVPHPHPRGRHDGALAAAPARALGGAEP